MFTRLRVSSAPNEHIQNDYYNFTNNQLGIQARRDLSIDEARTPGNKVSPISLVRNKVYSVDLDVPEAYSAPHRAQAVPVGRNYYLGPTIDSSVINFGSFTQGSYEEYVIALVFNQRFLASALI